MQVRSAFPAEDTANRQPEASGMVGTEDFAVMSATADRRGARHHMRNTSLALAAAATLAVSAVSPAYADAPTYPGPGGYPYWSGYVNAPVLSLIHI